MSGYITHAIKIERSDCTVTFTNIPVRPHPACKYFDDNVAVVPLITKTADCNHQEKESAGSTTTPDIKCATQVRHKPNSAAGGTGTKGEDEEDEEDEEEQAEEGGCAKRQKREA
jgi:hypothetical protein